MRKMLRSLIPTSLMFLTLAVATPAPADDFGLGIILGSPTGISAKVKTARGRAFDVAAAWSLGNHESFQLHADYLFQGHAFNIEKQAVDVHYGIGGRMRFFDSRFADDLGIGARIPLGLSAMLNRSPVEVFFEIALVMEFIPETDADGDAGIGIRYYF